MNKVFDENDMWCDNSSHHISHIEDVLRPHYNKLRETYNRADVFYMMISAVTFIDMMEGMARQQNAHEKRLQHASH